jgi:hypothetical protein
MTDSSDAFQRIKEDYKAFCESIKKCRMAKTFDRAEWQDAYERGARVRDRFRKERRQGNLTQSELKVLSKVFDDDEFTKGMMETRNVGEHAQKRQTQESIVIRTPYNQPIELSGETSAMQMFAEKTVSLTDIKGNEYRVNHLEQLETLAERMRRAIDRANS